MRLIVCPCSGKINSLHLLEQQACFGSMSTLLLSSFSVHEQFVGLFQAKARLVFVEKCGE